MFNDFFTGRVLTNKRVLICLVSEQELCFLTNKIKDEFKIHANDLLNIKDEHYQNNVTDAK